MPNKNKQYDDPADAAALEYLVQIRHPGRYRLFFYGGGLSPKDNSVQMGIDGVYPIQLSNLKLKEGKYIWFGRAMAVNDHPWIVFPQAGLYRFTVHGREDGTWLDRLALSPESRGTTFPTLNEALAEIEDTDNVERK